MFERGMVKVIDNFIDKKYQESIKEEMFGSFDRNGEWQQPDFPWFYSEDVTAAGDPDSQHRPAMCHQYVEYIKEKTAGRVISEYNDIFTNLLKKVGLELGLYNINILQGRSFLQFPILKERKEPDLPHIDLFNRSHIVALYYIIDSDGDTIIYNEREDQGIDASLYTIKQKVTPKQGRIVIFDGGLYHTAEQPLNSTRCIANYNIT